MISAIYIMETNHNFITSHCEFKGLKKKQVIASSSKRYLIANANF
jgi:hypothetical protein